MTPDDRKIPLDASRWGFNRVAATPDRQSQPDFIKRFPLMFDELINSTVEQLMVGADLKHPDLARAMLHELLTARHPDNVFIVPIARRLMGLPDWPDWLRIDELIAFAKPRAWICRLLSSIPRGETDAASDYMVGLTIDYAFRHGYVIDWLTDADRVHPDGASV